MVLLLFLLSVLFSIIPKKAERCKSRTQIIGKIDFQGENNQQILLQKTAVELAQLGGKERSDFAEPYAIGFPRSMIENRLFSNEDEFDDEFKGKKVVGATGFILECRLWKVEFDDGSWIIASDAGNGWYRPETKFNSYKFA